MTMDNDFELYLKALKLKECGKYVCEGVRTKTRTRVRESEKERGKAIRPELNMPVVDREGKKNHS